MVDDGMEGKSENEEDDGDQGGNTHNESHALASIPSQCKDTELKALKAKKLTRKPSHK